TLQNPGAAQILRNVSFGNRDGIVVSNPGQPQAVLEANLVHDNAVSGIAATYNVLVTGNTIFGHAGTSGVGLSLYYNSGVADSNVIYGNTRGIDAYSVTIRNNRVYANTSVGIDADYSDVLGNVVYSNALGLRWLGAGPYEIANNIVYANAGGGVEISGTNGLTVRNNTIQQRGGDGIEIKSRSVNVGLRNNIVRAHHRAR